MKTGFVNSRSFLEGDHRIDPDLYLSDGAKIRREIHNLLGCPVRCANFSSLF